MFSLLDTKPNSDLLNAANSVESTKVLSAKKELEETRWTAGLRCSSDATSFRHLVVFHV